jgi:hypothetical protein
VQPDVIFNIFTLPDNSRLFRDIHGVGERKVVSHAPGLRVVEVRRRCRRCTDTAERAMTGTQPLSVGTTCSCPCPYS